MKDEEYLPYGEDKAGRAVWECLKRMYKESEPSADIEKIAKSGESRMPNFFMGYYLSQKRCSEIVEEVCKAFKIRRWEKRKVETTLWLGSSPTSVKERWLEERKDYDKRVKSFLKQKISEEKNE